MIFIPNTGDIRKLEKGNLYSLTMSFTTADCTNEVLFSIFHAVPPYNFYSPKFCWRKANFPAVRIA